MTFFEQYDAALSSPEAESVRQARTFCQGGFSADVHQAYLANEPFSPDWIGKWAALGMFGLQTRAEHGGRDFSFLCKIRVAQEMAQHSFAAAFSLNNLQGQATRVSRAGTDEQRSMLLSGLLDGSILSAPSMSEPSSGSDLGGLATIATEVSGGWLLNGTKSWITNGTLVNCLTMLVKVAGHDGLATLIVRLGDQPTYERREMTMPGGRSFRLAEISFNNHFVPQWALLNKPGEAVRASMAAVNAARVHVAAMCVATLYASLCEATQYCASRLSSGKPLTDHQGLQWELAEVATRLEAANALVFRVAQLVSENRPAVTLAAQCKKFAVDTAIWGIDQCIRAMGATGASNAHRLTMHLAEVRLAAFADGTNEMMLDRIGRNLKSDYDMPLLEAGDDGAVQ